MHSDYFRVQRGVRQGDPLSSYLFIIAVEVLSVAIRTNSNIQGIKIGDNEIKFLQYADDTKGVLKDQNSLSTLLDVLKSYEKASGLRINISKSECMWIGVNRGCKQESFGLRWPDPPIKCLGVYFTYDVAEFVNLNFKRRLKKMQKSANWWKARGLTVIWTSSNN